jgi:ribosomal protein L29
MKFSDLEKKTVSEIYDLYGNLKQEQLNLRMKAFTDGSKDTSRVCKARREIAQVKTKLAQLKKA